MLRHSINYVFLLFLAIVSGAGVSATVAADLPRCKDSDTKTRHNCFGTHVFGAHTKWAGDRYTGTFKNNKMHGRGTYNFASGGTYVGEFRDNEIHGQGTYSFATGSVYTGEFHNGKKQGRGTYRFASGAKYVGQFHNNRRHGQGTYTYPSGSVYVGGFKDDKFHGNGTYSFGPGTKYAGDKYIGGYRNGHRDGEGTYIFADGRKDVGTFRRGALNGYAVRYNADGSIQKAGIWKNDKFQNAQSAPGNTQSATGYETRSKLPLCPANTSVRWNNCFGRQSFKNGNAYAGEFKNGTAHGYGTYRWKSGAKYEGQYRLGKKHGAGKYSFVDGSSYIGGYRDGKRHGQGVYTFANGARDVGEFKNGKLNGFAVRYRPNGSVQHKGYWRDDKFIGTSAPASQQPAKAKTDPNSTKLLPASSGSGFAVSKTGHIITNNHVIKGCQEISIHHKGSKLPATVIAFDPQNDLALLKADFTPTAILPLSRKRPEILQDIYVAGYPFGKRVSNSIKVTKGIISSLTGLGNNFSEIQIDAALQTGNSGGPILDMAGNVVGVAVAKLDIKYALKNFGTIPENTNFGIKSSIVRSILDSNDVTTPPPSETEISKSDLGRKISNGTYYISCLMTVAQMRAMKTNKVMFD